MEDIAARESDHELLTRSASGDRWAFERLVGRHEVVGGPSCSEVLDRLSDYVDGDLAAEERTKVEAHLRGCEGCARFGGEFRGTVAALRSNLLGSVSAPPRVRSRLREALGREPDGAR